MQILSNQECKTISNLCFLIHSNLKSLILYDSEVKHIWEDPQARKHLYKDTSETGFRYYEKREKGKILESIQHY